MGGRGLGVVRNCRHGTGNSVGGPDDEKDGGYRRRAYPVSFYSDSSFGCFWLRGGVECDKDLDGRRNFSNTTRL